MDWDTPVTLFVVNIAPTLPDTFITKILRLCGKVLRWRRASGVKDDPCDFGFVDYGSPLDAMCALRVLPKISILDRVWDAKIDKSQHTDLLSFDQTRQMRADYDEEKDFKKDQLTLGIVNEIVSSSAFARPVPRLTEVLYSENDESRESEHYRYLSEIRKENDEFEEQFRQDLLEWRKTEIRLAGEREEMKTTVENDRSDDRNARDRFLMEWKPPPFTEEGKEAFVDQWRRFLQLRGQRRLLRSREEEIEKLLS
jgi:hypothetical protein